MQSNLIRYSLLALTSAVLVACGGGDASTVDAPPQAPNPPATNPPATNPPATNPPAPNPPAPNPPATVTVSRMRVAQTHVMPPEGLQWSQPAGKTIELHLAGGRPALMLVDTTPSSLSGAQVEGRVGTTVLGRVSLADNSALPPTEANGERYSSTARVATLPASWVQTGLELRVLATNMQPSAWQAINVGAETSMALRTVPFYMFGATEAQASLSAVGMPPAQARDELYAKWPISHLSIEAHPAHKVVWPQVVIAPRGGRAAYVMSRAEDLKDGFDPIAAVKTTVSALLTANGESGTNSQIYGAMVMARSDGTLQDVGGGLGGGHTGAGDTVYGGVFVHEQGHAFGMPHAGDSHNSGSGYPYRGGSLNGSQWGFDQVRQRFMSTLVPSNASSYPNCTSDTFANTPRQRDAQGRCIRQDPMQSGAGDQAAGDYYSLFSDYNAAVVQRYLEGVASVNSQGRTVWDGGRVHVSAASSTGYRRWNSLTRSWVAYDPSTESNSGLYGINDAYPVARNVPVYTLVLTRSNAGTAGATMIYPPIGPYTGNLLRTIDPTNAADRAAIVPNTGTYPWYCHGGGCDLTVRVSYANGTVRHVLLQGCFRPWFRPTDPPTAAATDPVNGESFRYFAVNVPADAAITRVELLDTPQGYQGLPPTPAVLTQR